MAITTRDPNTIKLAGDFLVVDDIPAGAAITPGYLIEMYSDSGALKWRKNSSATEITAMAVALDQTELNKGVDDAYAAGDLVKAGFVPVGGVFWGLIPSGQNIAVAALLQSNGDGLLKAATATTEDANLGKFQALEAKNATANTRIRVQRIQ